MGASIGAVGQAGTGLINAKTQANAIKAQGEFQQKINKMNISFAEEQGKDAIARGKKDSSDIRKQGQRVVGSQRAALAAQGIEIDSGSALEIQADTAGLAEIDAITTKNNAMREAFGFKTQAISASMSGQLASFATATQARQTMTTAGINSLNSLSTGATAYADKRQAAQKDSAGKK